MKRLLSIIPLIICGMSFSWFLDSITGLTRIEDSPIYFIVCLLCLFSHEQLNKIETNGKS